MAEQRLIDAEALKHEILEICKYNCFTVIKPTSEQCNGCEIWGKHFWLPSYFLATTGNVTIDILKQYVENQRKDMEK